MDEDVPPKPSQDGDITDTLSGGSPPLGLAPFPIGLCKPSGTTQQTLEKAKTQTQDSIKRKEVGQRSEET